MTQTGPWSVKGIDQRARDAARDAAMAEGLTLGEYLNRLLLASEAPAPREIAEPFETARPKPDAASNALDRLTRRIEATEARSTLAITGMDHTVLGLVARLENAEQGSAAIAGHVEGLIDEIKYTHEALQTKVRRLEQDDSARQNLEALKSLENALGKLASHVYEENELAQSEGLAIKGRVEAGFADVNERVERMETKVERTLSEAAARVEKAVSQAELRTEGAARHLSDRMSQIEAHVNERLSDTGDVQQRLNDVEADVSGALTSMESTLVRIQDRLNRAETTTDKAIQQLETTFDHLDKRIQTVASSVDPELAARLRKEFEARFEDMTRLVREAIGNTRLELADEISRAAISNGDPEFVRTLEARVDTVQRELADTAARQSRQIETVADAVSRQVKSEIAADVSERLASFSDRIEERLEEVSLDSVAPVAETVRAEVERMNLDVSARLDTIADQIDKRVSDSEERQARAIEQVGEQVSVAANRLQKRQDETLRTLATQIDDNRKRSDTRLSDALSNVSERLELMQAQTATTMSPVQKAIASLATRLENLEEFASPPFVERAATREIPPIPALPINAPLYDGESENAAIDADLWDAKPVVKPIAASAALDPYTEDYAAIRAASERITPAAASAVPNFVAEVFGEPDDDTFTDALSELGAEDARSEARDSDIFETNTPANPRLGALPIAPTEPAGEDYISRARKAAITAASDSGARAPKPRTSRGAKQKPIASSGGGGKAPLYAAGAAVAITGAAVGGYLYLRGNQTPIEPISSSAAAIAPAPITPKTTAPVKAAVAAAPVAASATIEEELFGPETPAPESVSTAKVEAPAPSANAIKVAVPPKATSTPAPVKAVVEPTAKTVAAPVAEKAGATVDTAALFAPIPAVVSLEAAANSGNSIAQYQSAEAKLAAGDFQGGAALMRRAAQRGAPMAQYGLSKLHEKGTGVPKDLTQAREWTEKAASAGNVKAMYNLAVFMAEGEGGPQTYAGAADWFLKSADFGLINSQYNIAMLYEQGLGVSANLVEALFWFEVAGLRGDKDATAKAGELRGRVSSEAAKQAKDRATAWSPKRDEAIANGRFGAQPWEVGNPLQVQGVQAALNALGFKAGTPDGVVSADTGKAIRAYQTVSKLEVTGTITPALISSLNAKAAPTATKG